MKKKNIAILLVLSLLLACSATSCAKFATTYTDYLDLGNKYLLDAKYDKAMVAFNKSIQIDPKQPDAYFALADTYIARGDDNTAQDVADILEQGYAQQDTDDGKAAFEQKRQSIADAFKQQGHTDWAAQLFLKGLLISYETNGVLICDNFDDYDNYYGIQYLKDWISMGCTYPLIYLDSAGINGIGVYQGTTQTMEYQTEEIEFYIYIGGYSDGQRSGHGVWLSFQDANYMSGIFDGEWASDLPNGMGTEYTFYGDYPDYYHKGTLLDGLWNGDVYCIAEYPSDNDSPPVAVSFTIGFKAGRATAIGPVVHLGWGIEDVFPVGHYENGNICYMFNSYFNESYGISGFSANILPNGNFVNGGKVTVTYSKGA